MYKGTKKDFVNSYLIFDVPEKEFKENDKMISFKEHGSSMEVLINAEDKKFFSDKKLREPDLEEIMIHLEKEGKTNEEFDL